MLQVSVISGYYTDRTKLGFNYTVLSFEKNKMTLQLDFENPLIISREPVDPEILKIVVNDIQYFFTSFGKTISIENSELQKKLPPIY